MIRDDGLVTPVGTLRAGTAASMSSSVRTKLPTVMEVVRSPGHEPQLRGPKHLGNCAAGASHDE